MINKQDINKNNFFSLENTLLESSDSCIIATDLEGFIQIFNPSAEKVFNCSWRDVIGKVKLLALLKKKLKDVYSEIDSFIISGLNGGQSLGEFNFHENYLSPFKATLKITPLYSPSKTIEGVLCILDKKPAGRNIFCGFDLLMQYGEDSFEGIAILDSELRFMFVSKNWCKQHNLAENLSLSGKYYYQIFPDIPIDWKKMHKRILSGKVEKKDEDLVIDGSGNCKWVKWYARPWYFEGGEVGGILLFMEDITERKLNELAIKENELLLRSINYASSQFLSSSDFNQVIKNTLEVIGKTTQADSIAIYESNSSSSKGKGAFSQRFEWSKLSNDTVFNQIGFQNLLYSAKGLERWQKRLKKSLTLKGLLNDFPDTEKSYLSQRSIKSILVIPIFITDKFWGFIEFTNSCKERVWSDIEESFLSTYAYSIGVMISKNETEKLLIDSKNYLNHIFNSAPLPIFVKDTSHRWTSYNQAFAELIGFSGDELIGKSDFDVFPKEYAQSYWEKDDEVFSTGKENILEEMVKNKNGEFRTMITRKTLFKNHYGEEFLIGTLFDITDLKKINIELDNTKNYLNNIINAIGNPIFVKDSKHQFTLVNDSFCSRFKFSREQVIGKTSEELFPNFPKLKEKDNHAFKTGNSIITELEFNENGYTKTFISKVSVFSDHKKKKYLVGSLSDISEIKKKEVELRNSKNYLNTIINAIPASIFVKDRQHKFVLANNACCTLNEQNAEEIIGKTDYDLHSKSISNIFWDREEEIFETEKEVVFEEVIDTSEGEKFVITKKTTFKDEYGHKYLIGTNSDITERKKAEEIIAVKSQILNGILNYLPVIVFRVEDTGIITESMGSGWKALGLKDFEVVGKSIFELYPQEEHRIKALLRKGGFLDFDVSGADKGEEWFYRTFIFEDLAKKGSLIGFGIDVTEAKLSENKLKEYSISLEKSNKELDQFAYVVSHDLKAPLRAIANLSEWIEEDLGEEIKGDLKNNLNLLRGRVYRLQALINGILDYSKISRTKITYEEVDLSSLVDEVVSILGVPDTFKIIKSGRLPVVISNKLKLEQVFSNLISNSVKYHHKSCGTITIDCKEKSGEFEISVKDDGPGIAKEFHEKIFIIFQTLERRDKVESTGIGLTIVKKIIEEQGGNIRVESNEGKGTAFIFTIPKKAKVNKQSRETSLK